MDLLFGQSVDRWRVLVDKFQNDVELPGCPMFQFPSPSVDTKIQYDLNRATGLQKNKAMGIVMGQVVVDSKWVCTRKQSKVK
jgi:hypothetical protein